MAIKSFLPSEYILNEPPRIYVDKKGRTVTEEQMIERQQAQLEVTQLKVRDGPKMLDMYGEPPGRPFYDVVQQFRTSFIDSTGRRLERDENGNVYEKYVDQLNQELSSTLTPSNEEINRAFRPGPLGNKPPTQEKLMANVNPDNPTASDLPNDCIVQVKYPGSSMTYIYNAQGCKVGDFIVVGPTPVSRAPQALAVIGIGKPASSTYAGPLKRAMRVPIEMLG